MAISLTLEQALERLLEPQRLHLLRIAIDEDVKCIFPLQINLADDAATQKALKEALGNLIDRLLLRALRLAFEESLDKRT
jgi:hypothetical protein